MRIRIVVCISLIVCLAGMVRADTQWFASVNDLWSNPANWSNGVPTATEKAQFATSEVCIVDFEGAIAKHIAMDGAGAGHLRLVDGSELSVTDWTIVGYSASNVGDMACLIEVLGGVLNCQARCFVGFQGEGTMIVDGDGVVNILSQDFGVAQEATGTGSVELRGGELNVMSGNLSLRNGVKAGIDFSGGILTQQSNQARIDYINAAIDDGIMTAYSGQGKVVVDTETIEGRIIVKGIHSLEPTPIDGGTASAGQVELSWVLPDPCQAGQPVPVDVYFGTSPDVGSAQTPNIISRQNITSTVVQAQPKTRYYWAVDTYVGSNQDPILGPVFSFVADNLAPVVNAGKDQLTWLVDGSAGVTLDATVTDDGYLQPYIANWTVVSEPNEGTAVLDDANKEDTGVTFSETGEYVLQLTAFDGEYTGTDTMTINVYNDGCEAAKSLPDFVPIPGDINQDCVVNELDMAIVAEHWLESNALEL
ncbi:MAG: hypothetical protein WBC05_05960, partial [Sedimentisphaerales bacterium]